MRHDVGDPETTGPNMLRLLGPVECEVDGAVLGIGGPRQRAILALLALSHHTIGVDTIVDAVWGESPPPQVRRSLSTQIARLRRLIEPLGVTITHTGSGYRLRAPADWTDVDRFDRGLAQARGHLAAERLDAALEALDGARSLWRGPPMSDLADIPFVAGAATSLQQRRHAAEDDTLAALLRAGRATEALERSRPLIDELPYAEGRWAAHIEALLALGRRRDALAAFQDVRQRLEGVGMVPGLRLRELERAALGTAEALPGGRSSSAGVAQFVQLTARSRPSGPERFRAALLTGESLVERRDLPAARAALAMAVEEAPDRAAALEAGVRLGIVELASGNGASGVARLEESTRLARDEARFDIVADALLARAHLANSVSLIDATDQADEAMDVCERLDPVDIERTVRLLCWAADLLANVDPPRSRAILTRAEAARGLLVRPDLETLLMQVRLRLREAAGDDPTACRRDAEALVGHATRYGAPSVAAGAHIARLAALLRAGDLAGCRAGMGPARRAIEGLGEQVALVELQAIEAALALATGPLDEADALSESGLETASEQVLSAAIMARGMHLMLLARERCHVRDMEPMARITAAASPRPIFEVVVGLCELEAGEVEAAARRTARLLDEAVPHLTRDWVHAVTLALLADLASDALTDEPPDPGPVARLRAALLPFEEQCIVMCSYLGLFGRTQRYLGLLSLVLGDLDDAVERCAEARTGDLAAGSALWAGWAGIGEARARVRRGSPGDRARATELAGEAAAAARQVGSARLAAAAASVS